MKVVKVEYIMSHKLKKEKINHPIDDTRRYFAIWCIGSDGYIHARVGVS